MALRAGEQATLRAFAHALVDDTPEVALDVDALIERTSPRVRLGLRLALAAFEWSSFPRRFSRMPLARRRIHLEEIDARGRGFTHELLMLIKSLVLLVHGNDQDLQRQVGVTIGCDREGGDEASGNVPPLDRDAMVAGEGVERCDVVVVGSGAGGAAVARVLAEAGLSTIVVEEGDYYDAGKYSQDSFEATATLYRDGGLTVCEGRPAIPMPIGKAVGGTTVINSGTCFHAPEDVLKDWRDVHGIDWATGLAGEFEQLDRDLDVRSVDLAGAGHNARLCKAGADAIGASNGPLARNAGDVTRCSSCPYGCALDAKQAMHVSELPKAVQAGARIRSNTKVERVIFEGRKAVGVACKATGHDYEVRARAVVLAAGAVGTPQLLLNQGVSDLSGQIGRNLRIHPACWVGARFDEEVRGWDGIMQSWYVDEWHERGLFMEATFTPFAFGLHWLPGVGAELEQRISDYGKLAITGVHMSDRESHGRVRVSRSGHARISYRLDRADAAQIHFGIARAVEMQLAAGAREVFPQIAGIGVIDSRSQLGVLEQARVAPADLRLEAFHPMGTVRMGADRSTSVVAPTGESHELQGLFVADASIFPTSLGVNPMITIMAAARQIARGVAARLS